MISIDYYRNHHTVTISGHAGYGESGQDIICAAVSGLAFTLAGCVEQLYGKGFAEDAEISLAHGDAEIACKAVDGFDCIVSLVFDTVCFGLRHLADSFPEYAQFAEHSFFSPNKAHNVHNKTKEEGLS